MKVFRGGGGGPSGGRSRQGKQSKQRLFEAETASASVEERGSAWEKGEGERL